MDLLNLCIAAMKELNMNNSDTKTSAASSKSQNPGSTSDKGHPAKTGSTESEQAKTPEAGEAEPAKTEPTKPTKPPTAAEWLCRREWLAGLFGARRA